MDESQLFSVLKPILSNISKFQTPSINDREYVSQNWQKCAASLDQLSSTLTNYPSIIQIIHPISYFTSKSSLTCFDIPQSFSSTSIHSLDSIQNFNCIPYFIYNNNSKHKQTQILNNFCKLRCFYVFSITK